MGSHGAMCGPPAARENFRAAARGIVRRSACNPLVHQTYTFLPDAKGAIRGTFVEGRTGRQHEREEGAETVIRFSPLIVFPAGGPGPWFVHGRIFPRRRVSLCSRARGKEESVECPSCPSDSSQRAC